MYMLVATSLQDIPGLVAKVVHDFAAARIRLGMQPMDADKVVATIAVIISTVKAKRNKMMAARRTAKCRSTPKKATHCPVRFELASEHRSKFDDRPQSRTLLHVAIRWWFFT